MGNTNSAGQEVDTSLLSGLRYKTEETVAKDLTSQLKIDNELKLSKLATMILNEAVAKEGEQGMSAKYAKLVKLLCTIRVVDPKSRQFISFKDVFTKLLTLKLDELKQDRSIFLPSNSMMHKYGMFITLLGELFNADVYSATMISFWLDVSLEKHEPLKQQLLLRIRFKVETEHMKVGHEQLINSLMDMMVERGIVKLALTAATVKPLLPQVAPVAPAEPGWKSFTSQPITPVAYNPPSYSVLCKPVPARAPVDDDSSDSFDDDQHDCTMYDYENEFEEEEEIEEEASNYDYNYETESASSRSQSQSASMSLPDLFEAFVLKLEINRGHKFNLNRFRACSEADRKECARLVLKAVISHPKIIVPLSLVMRTIQSSQPPKNVNHLKFTDHLSTFCEAEIESLVKKTSKWTPLSNMGVFLGHLFNMSCIKNGTMNKWLDGVQIFVDKKNVRATNVLLEVLKLTLNSLKMKDHSKFKFYVIQVQKISTSAVFVTPILTVWMNSTVRTYSESSQVTVGRSTATTSTSSIPQQSTGAIRKTPTVPVQLPPQKPAPSNKNQIMLVQQKLNKMYDKHDPQQILNEIVALKIESSESNLRKIANMIASKIMSRPDVIKSSIEILSLLPHRSNPPFAANELKKQLKLSLLDQYYYLQDSKVLAVQQLENLLSFTTRLISKKLVDDEIITEITENLALTARNGGKVPLEILIKFIGTYGCFLLAHPLMLKETATTLNKHSKSSSSEVRNNVGEALKWIAPKEVQAKPVQQAEQCQPSTSAAAAQVDIKKIYCDFLLELPLKSIEDIKLLLSKIRSPDQCEEFAAAYYEAVMKTEQFMLFAKFAQLVEKEFEVAGFRPTFVDSLIQVLYASYTPITQEQMKASKAVQSRVQFIGELYKIKWIDIDGLAIVMDMLSETELLVELFLTLLQIVSLAVVKNGDGEKLKKYRELYSNRQDGYEKSTSDFLTCTEVVEILEDVASLSGKRVVFDNNLAQAIIGSLNTENIDEQAEKIKSMTKGSANEFEIIVNAIVNQVGKFGDEKLMASFSQKLVRVFEGLESLLKEKLEEKCQDLLLEHVAQNANAKKLQNSILVEFYAELYLRNVLSSNFIVLCCDILCDGVDEHNDFSLHTMVSMVGAKLEDDDKDAAVKIFKKFNGAIAADETESYFVKSLQSLVDMRENGWTMTGNLQSLSIQQDQKANALLNKLTRANLTSISTCKEVTRLCESSPKELVVSIYYSVIQNANKAEVYADLCDIISRHSSAFQDQLKDFLRFCIGKVSALKKQDFQDDTRSDLAHLTVFIGELFVRDLIDEDLLTVLLKPAKNLRFDSINQLAAVIGHKVNESANIRLKAVLINLEDVAQEDTKQCWEDLKKDIGEITEIVSKNAEMETVVVAEPTTIFYTSSDVP